MREIKQKKREKLEKKQNKVLQIYDWNNVPGTIVNLSSKPVNLTIGQDLPTSVYSTNSNSPYYVNWGGYFIGAIDDLRIYKTAISAAEVTSIYNLEKP